MTGNSFALTVIVRFTRNTISHGVIYVTGTEVKNNITNAGGRMALSTSDFITGKFHHVCGRVRACIRASRYELLTFVVDLNNALDEKQWDH